MKTSEKMYNNVQDIWSKYLIHPFVKGLADGSLPVDKFKYYLKQDYLYLKDYARVFAASASKSDSFKDIEFLSDNLSAVLDETFRVHIPYMKRLGITDEDIESLSPHIDNTSYTHYMLSEALAGNTLTGIVTILACSWSYYYIATEMVNEYPNAAEHIDYGDWFKGYICDEYDETNRKLIEMTDRLAEGLDEKEEAKLIEIFRKCSIYEYRFWNMAWNAGKEGTI